MQSNLWPELDPSVSAQVEAALAAGNKIEAIVIYRQATKAGLKEAKDAIERADSLRPPLSSTPSRPNSNWLTIFLVLIISAIVLIFLVIRMR